MSTQRRVLFVNNVGQIGGAEQSLLTLIDGLIQQKWPLCLVCPPDGTLLKRANQRGIETLPLPLVDSVKQTPLRYFNILWQFIKTARAWQPDLIHCNGIRSVLYGVPAGKLLRIPVIVHIRDIDLPPSPITRSLIKQADLQIAISNAVKATLQQNNLARSCVVIYNGVNVAAFQNIHPQQREQMRTTFRIPIEGCIVGIIGRLIPWKGHETFLAAAAQLRHYPHLYWLIVGEEWHHSRGYQQYLTTLATHLGIGNRVRFTGWLEDVPAAFSMLDIVVVPSQEPEPFGRVVIEAMAAKRPVVASRIGGISEIICDERTGLLVPPRDVNALANQIQRLVVDPILYRTIVAQALGNLPKFSQENHLKEVIKVYQQL